MEAVLRPRSFRQRIRFRLDDGCKLVSGIEADSVFDSSVEEAFAMAWGEQPRDGWRLERETEILHVGQTAFFPDFVFVNEDGRRAMLEIVGFWTPEYLIAKFQVLNQFRDEPVFLAIAQSLKEKVVIPSEHPAIYYKGAIDVVAVLAMLNGR